jgi:hypothetical protein
MPKSQVLVLLLFCAQARGQGATGGGRSGKGCKIALFFLHFYRTLPRERRSDGGGLELAEGEGGLVGVQV